MSDLLTPEAVRERAHELHALGLADGLQLERPSRERSVGLANGSNPIPIVIPCHRVIGANGTLTGYAGGVERKQLLLSLEQDALF